MKKEPNIIFKFVIPLLLIFLFSGRSLAADVKLLTNQEYLSLLQDKIRTAREEILVSMYLFRTSENERNLSTRLRADLISAASRGVKVSVLLEKEKRERKGSSLNEDNRHTAAILSRGGVKVFFDKPDVTTHTKLVIIDNRFVFIGSHNFSDSALGRNNEASVMVDSPEMAGKAASFIKGIR